MKQLISTYLGCTDYKEIWDLQKQLFELRAENKIPDILLLNEHNHVYTIGKSGNGNHLLMHKEELRSKGVDVFDIDRGGDITYHGPGQLVGYPILDLKDYYLDTHRYLRDLEEVIILTLQDFGIVGTRLDGLTGVWIDGDKIAALGIKVSRWITMHGFAFNVNTDLSFFDRIIPCGIFHKGITSLQQVLGRRVMIAEVNQSLLKNFEKVFKVDILNLDKQDFFKQITKQIRPSYDGLTERNINVAQKK